MATMVIVLAFSCSSEDGEDGAMGIQGEQGVAGQNGANGTDGVDGEDGNANVIASDWFGPTGQYSINNGYTSYAELEVTVPGLDTETYDSATLLVYAKFSNFIPEVWPTNHSALLPLTISGGTTGHFFTYYYSSDILKIRYRRDPEQIDTSFSTSTRFRYIFIPASTLASKNNIDYAKMTYEEVMDYFGLGY